MACVIKRTGKFYAQWKDAAGNHRRQVTSCQTRKEAQRYAEDLERKSERQRMGLEPLPEAGPCMTFGELLEWWMVEYGSRLRGEVGGFLRKRLLPKLDRLPLPEVTSARLEGLFHSFVGELSPKSINSLRGSVHTIFRRAMQRGRWPGMNPAAAVERLRVQQKVYDTLRAEEVPVVLDHLNPCWRPLFATAVFTGMRKGELLGLKKTDVDLVAGAIAVRRSYDHETTKSGRAELIPIAAPLRRFLIEAMFSSRSEYVFPAADGSMRPRNTKLQYVLARALARAGMFQGYLQVCTRMGCGHRETAKDADQRDCPRCRFLLSASGIPRHVRFHDLRGTTATLLARAGVSIVVAQRILRHSDPRLTANIYSRVDLADLQAGIDRLGIVTAVK